MGPYLSGNGNVGWRLEGQCGIMAVLGEAVDLGTLCTGDVVFMVIVVWYWMGLLSSMTGEEMALDSYRYGKSSCVVMLWC